MDTTMYENVEGTESVAFDGLLRHEHLAQTFNWEQFYITEREQKLVDRLVKMEGVTRKLQAAGVNYRHTALIFGPEGTGKTALAKYIALTMGREFFMVDMGELEKAFGPNYFRRGITTIFKTIESGHSGGETLLFIDRLDVLSGCNVTAVAQALSFLSAEAVVLSSTSAISNIAPTLRQFFPIQHQFDGGKPEDKVRMALKYLHSVKQKADFFPFAWDDSELTEYITNLVRKSSPTNASLIIAINQIIADTVEKGRDAIVFPLTGGPAT